MFSRLLFKVFLMNLLFRTSESCLRQAAPQPAVQRPEQPRPQPSVQRPQVAPVTRQAPVQ